MSKRESEQETDVDSSLKRPRPTEEGGVDLGDDRMGWLLMEDDTVAVADLINFLDAKPLTRVKFIDNPYTSPLIIQSYSSYVTINGNEETCGSSFSDAEASLIVSVDMQGIVNSKWVVEENGGDNGWDLDDYVLARFLREEALVFYLLFSAGGRGFRVFGVDKLKAVN